MDTLLPPRCIVTGEIVDSPGMVAPEAWASLKFIADPQCRSCGLPFSFEAGVEDEGPGVLCAACLADPPPFETARSALVYDDVSRDVILRFKHADQTHAAHSFVPWLRRAGAEALEAADILVPVPLHRWRLFRRRYNQAALIARTLGRQTGIRHIPDALLRTRSTPAQGHLGAAERARNVRRAFAVNPAWVADLAGKNAVLVDDVYTTGSTVKECARALLDGGVARVDVLTVARVVRPESLG